MKIRLFIGVLLLGLLGLLGFGGITAYQSISEKEKIGLLNMFSDERTDLTEDQQEFKLTVEGFGIKTSLKPPVAAAHIEGGTLILGPIDATGLSGEEIKNVLIKPGKAPSGPIDRRPIPDSRLFTYSDGNEGSTEIVLGRGMEDYKDLLNGIVTTEDTRYWTLATDNHQITWPVSLTLRFDGKPHKRTVGYEFNLSGEEGNLAILNGPFFGKKEIPPPEQLIAPYQEVVDQNASLQGTVGKMYWMELGYEIEGAEWRQRIYYIPIGEEAVYLLVSQAEIANAKKMFEAADIIATSLKPLK